MLWVTCFKCITFSSSEWKQRANTEWDIHHYVYGSKRATSVWTHTLLPRASAWIAYARHHQCQPARTESWQREVDCGSCDALPSRIMGGGNDELASVVRPTMTWGKNTPLSHGVLKRGRAGRNEYMLDSALYKHEGSFVCDAVQAQKWRWQRGSHTDMVLCGNTHLCNFVHYYIRYWTFAHPPLLQSTYCATFSFLPSFFHIFLHYFTFHVL